MARPRLPAAKADVSGAAVKDPQRHRSRKSPSGTKAIGAAPKRLTAPQREAWKAFTAELPWLNSSHRALLHAACVLRARVENDPDIGVNALQTYSAILSKLAATPVDETKVSMPDDGEDDPEDALFH
ncbi:hypothetical protein ACM64Y_00585 [Novispirillum sp. DQ9]|uniref:hypothetical protein n=1 Tax=Novispirillum sp. DQ9 TaxID=3398612 RepID=UPI003C7E6600